MSTATPLGESARRLHAPPPSRAVRFGIPAVLWVLVFVVHLTSTNVMIADSGRSVYVASEIVHHQNLTLNRYLPDWGGDQFALEQDGTKTLPFFPWGPPLFAIPTVVAWDVLHDLRGGLTFDQRITSVGKTWPFQVVSMAYVVAFTALVLYFVALRLLTGVALRRRRWTALAVALIFAFCTAAWSTASRSLWQHGPSMLFLSLAVLFALRALERPRNFIGLGACVAASFVMRPTDAVVVATFSVWVALAHRRQIGWYALGAGPVAVVFLWVNKANYGTWLTPYYHSNRLGSPQDGYQVHFLRALAGNLISPGRGLFIYMPVLLLAFAGVSIKLRTRSFTSLDAVLIGSVVLHWVSISLFPQWWGGDSYGPRLFSDMVPYCLLLCLPVAEALAAPSWRRRRGPSRWAVPMVAGVLVAASFGVQVQAAYLTSSWCWNDTPVSVDKNPSRLWSWSNPQFIAGFRGLVDGIPHEFTRAGVLKYGCPPGSAPS